MKKRILSIIIIAVMLILCLTGCDDKEPSNSGQNEKEDDKVQIGFCFDSFVIERWQRDRDVFVSMAKELGAEVNIQNANGDIEEQKKQIDYFIKKNMDVIVIVCIDSTSLKSSVKKARDEGIKVIAYDRLIKDGDVDLYVSFDNKKVGEMMGQALALIGAVFVSAGLFVSTLTESQMVAAIGSIALNAALALINVIASIIPVQVISDIVKQLSVFDRYYEFTTGIFSISGVVFFISAALIFMFLTVRVLERRRWA